MGNGQCGPVEKNASAVSTSPSSRSQFSCVLKTRLNRRHELFRVLHWLFILVISRRACTLALTWTSFMSPPACLTPQPGQFAQATVSQCESSHNIHHNDAIALSRCDLKPIFVFCFAGWRFLPESYAWLGVPSRARVHILSSHVLTRKRKGEQNAKLRRLITLLDVLAAPYFTEYPLASMHDENALRKVSSFCCCCACPCCTACCSACLFAFLC